MFFKKKNKVIDSIYEKVVSISRKKKFYTHLKVPDTFDGRFDMLILFTILVVYKLNLIKPQGHLLSQKLFDTLFKDLDYSLRELGAGDVGVISRIKKMSSAYLGRQKSYCELFKSNNLEGLITSLNNNVYRNVIVDQQKVKLLALFCFQTIKKLNNYKEHSVLEGNFDFPSLRL